MRSLTVVALLFVSVNLKFTCSKQLEEYYTKTLRIPLSTYSGKDRLLYGCTGLRIEPDQYIIGFDPQVELNGVHHMSIQLCEDIHEDVPVWDCLDPKRVCKGKKDAIYAWGNGAPGWELPEVTGISTGSKSSYVVFQVHGHHEGKVQSGSAGMGLSFRRSRPQYDAAMMVLGNVGHIPANTRDFTTDTACTWNVDINAPLFNYGLHTHEHGTSISGYIIRNGTWIEIGRGDPNYPLVIYDVTEKKLEMKKGDIIAARCTFDNNENRTINMGYGDENEMCNLYLHYGVPHDAPDYVRTTSCVANVQQFTWESSFKDIPNLASDTSGDTEQNRYVIRHHMKKVVY